MRWGVGLSCLALGTGAVCVLLSLSLTRQAPMWWRSVRPDDPRVAARAASIENTLVNDLYAGRPGDEGFRPAEDGSWRSQRWTLRISAAEANAWLSARLPKWLANREDPVRLPKEIAELQVGFDDGVIRVGALVRAGGDPQIVSATLEPRLAPDGALWLPARWLHLGRLPVPAGPLLERAEAGGPDGLIPASLMALPETAAMFRAFAGEAPIVSKALIRLEDGRRVRVLGVSARDGVLEITCQTEVQ